MTDAVLEIKAWGNSLGVRIPSAVARAARLSANQSVRLTVADGSVVITPQAPRALSLAERLERYDPALHGGEAMPTTPIGAEKI